VLALALRWILDSGPTIALWGARRPEQLDPIAEVIGWSLDDASLREIDRILPHYEPGWSRIHGAPGERSRTRSGVTVDDR
jgi:aryl-alcohol dehydrogenase-like predicted oxidoreductase